MKSDLQEPSLPSSAYWELSEEGPFAALIEKFQSRLEQQAMANKVKDALEKESVLIAEAGTGTGKTFAYLVPAVLSKQKVLVSTGTKNLQDQLFFRDLPTVLRALDTYPKIALLKGRANYLCLHRMKQHLSGGLFDSKSLIADLKKVEDWARVTRDGDIASVEDVEEKSMVWPAVTSTVDNCQGSDCPEYHECYVAKARRVAMDAQVVVVNHHLFFADAELKEDGFGELLPQVDAVIFDEAHQVPEIASTFFSDHFSSRQVLELSRVMVEEYEKTAGDTKAINDMASELRDAVNQLQRAFGESQQRMAWYSKKQVLAVAEASAALETKLSEAKALLKEASVRSKELDACFVKAAQLLAIFKQFSATYNTKGIQWFETFKQSFVLHDTPLKIDEPFQNLMKAKCNTWVFTSATIAVDTDMAFFAQQLGITQYDSLTVASPFDYKNNALLYVPRYLPEPKQETYVEALMGAVLPLVELSKGKTFFLLTSYRALNAATEILKEKLSLPLLIQGTRGKGQLLDQFRKRKNAVLLGTSSFWEGVDIKGEQLSLVVIDRLPFAAPNDPLLKAKMELIRSAGGDPFADMQIPDAIISLKQGVGRLIRDQFDRGLLVIGDQRLVNRAYGARFLASLPGMSRTRDAKVAEAFTQKLTEKP